MRPTGRLNAERRTTPHGTGRSRRAAGGFTLVEVLVAVAVVAITLGAGLRAAGVLIDNSQRLSDVIAAQWCAENHLANMKLLRQFPSVGEADFSCEQLGRRYGGRTVVSSQRFVDLRLIDVMVSDDTGRQLVRLSTLLYRQ